MDLLLPQPDNVRGKFGSYVTNDMYDIAKRIKEVDPSLCIQLLDPPVTFGADVYNFAIVELCKDGEERLVYRTAELDGRVPEYLQYLLKVPFAKRFAEAERIEQKHKDDAHEESLDKLYEEMGGPMEIQLERCGFTQRPISFAKTNPVARRARAQERLRRLSIEA